MRNLNITVKIWLSVGVVVGTVAARHPNSKRAWSAMLFVFAGLSIPTFIFGIALVYLFTGVLIHGLDLFPHPGDSWTPFLVNPLQWAHGLILPWITLAFVSSATYVRLWRSSLRDVLGEDYITAARARGISEWRITYSHALRAAVSPIMIQFGIDLATVLGGAIITESIFGLPGLGLAVVQAIQVQNLPVVIGIVLIASFFVVAANIVVDALYAILDPRVRVS